jgi:hypothetical protein
MVTRILPLALLTAAVSLLLSGGASAQVRPTEASPARTAADAALPSPAAAQAITRRLWSRREAALEALSTARLAPIETASAKLLDTSYVGSVLCKCELRKDRHPVNTIAVQVPTASVKPIFFAEVRTTNATNRHPWYLLAIERTHGAWKIGLVAWAGYTLTPPLLTITRSNAATPAVTAASYARIANLARASIAYGKAHAKLVGHTSYGATIHIRPELHPAADGVYGLAVPGGKVFSCFTIHSVETYSLPGGLSQGAAKKQWGPLLPAGGYKTITVDNAVPTCTLGKGVGSVTGALRFTYDLRVVATSGVPV